MASFIMRYWMKVRGGGSAVFTPPAPGEVPSNAILLEDGVSYLGDEDGNYIVHEGD